MRRIQWACWVLLLLAAPLVLAQPQTVLQVPITDAEKHKLDTFVAGRDLLKITDYASPELDSIGPVEQLIFRKAVLLGGLNARFEDLVVPNSARARMVIRSGDAVGGGQGQWHRYYLESPDDYRESDAVIAQGAYEKGLYTTAEKARTLKISRSADLRPYAAVTSDSWAIDLATLRALPLKAVYSASTRPAQFRVVQSGRADFTLQDFAATADMSIEEQGVRLYPVPGVKIALEGTRHFLISRNHRDGEKVFAALQTGLRIMQQRGEIKQILSQSGFSHKEVKNWRLLNAPTPP